MLIVLHIVFTNFSILRASPSRSLYDPKTLNIGPKQKKVHHRGLDIVHKYLAHLNRNQKSPVVKTQIGRVLQLNKTVVVQSTIQEFETTNYSTYVANFLIQRKATVLG